MDAALKVEKELETTEPSSAISLEVDGELYFDVIKGLMTFARKQDAQLIYVAATVSASAIKQAMALIDVDATGVRFIDCISNLMTGSHNDTGDVIFIESPTMLESIMLKVEFIRKRSSGKQVTVVLDSLNTLHIHNDWKILGEFLHILVSGLKNRGAVIVIMSISEQQSQELNALLGLVSDKSVKVGGQ
ncbi:MAG: hypothetical protein QXP70_06125 [Methanomassiliicoccales archaeon]